MHDTAFAIGKLFFETYFPAEPPDLILEVGSQDVNGSLRSCAPPASTYIGVDLERAAGVDIVLSDPHTFPFVEEYFDATISTSCFEHDQMFWLTFIEMARVTRTGGYIYISAPANGWYDPHPMDSWRFYPDAGVALTAWARRQGRAITLMESFVARRNADIWNDCVMVFRKGNSAGAQTARIADRQPATDNIRRGASAPLQNFSQASEDMLLIASLKDQLRAKETELAALTALLDDCAVAFDGVAASLRQAIGGNPEPPPSPALKPPDVVSAAPIETMQTALQAVKARVAAMTRNAKPEREPVWNHQSKADR